MSTFNFNRFSQALKCHFLVERHTWIRLFGIFTLVLFMANLFFTRVANTNYQVLVENNVNSEQLYHTYRHIVEQTSVFAAIFFCFAMLIGASLMFRQMKDTRKRSAYLLWPVSNLEKYIVSFLHSFVLMFFLTIASIVVADALRVFIDWLTGRVIIWAFTIPFESINNPNSVAGDWQIVWMFFTWAFYFHSLYIVGGTLFRRQQFLFTSGTIVVVGILMIMLLNQIDFPQFDFITGHWDEKTETYNQIFHPAFYVLFTVLDLLIVFHYWASYKLFTRIQVINNKWLNV